MKKGECDFYVYCVSATGASHGPQFEHNSKHLSTDTDLSLEIFELHESENRSCSSSVSVSRFSTSKIYFFFGRNCHIKKPNIIL